MTTDPRQFNNAMGMPSKFKFTADSAGQVGESNEGNNRREEGFISLQIGEIGPGGAGSLLRPDLSYESMDFQVVSEAVINGKTIRTFKIAAKVKNIGKGSAPACTLMFDRGSDFHATVIWKSKPVPPLKPSEETIILSDDITHDMGTPGYYYAGMVDSAKIVQESDENNNYIGIRQYPKPGESYRPAPPRPPLR